MFTRSLVRSVSVGMCLLPMVASADPSNSSKGSSSNSGRGLNVPAPGLFRAPGLIANPGLGASAVRSQLNSPGGSVARSESGASSDDRNPTLPNNVGLQGASSASGADAAALGRTLATPDISLPVLLSKSGQSISTSAISSAGVSVLGPATGSVGSIAPISIASDASRPDIVLVSLAGTAPRQEPCNSLKPTPDCRPQGPYPHLAFSVPNPRLASLLAGTDERVPMEPTAWPWHAIGRVNIADSVNRRYCTGTLVGAGLVLTAAHCLYDHRLGRWAKPEHVHFVVGQARDKFLGHSKAEELIIPSQIRNGRPPDLQHGLTQTEQIADDWALIRLQTALSIRPVPLMVFSDQALVSEVNRKMVRAGYGADRPYLLSAHRNCSAVLADHQSHVMLNGCGSRPGDSGSPLLVFHGEEAFLVGLSTGIAPVERSDVGAISLAGLGPSAGSFANAVTQALALASLGRP
jgi:protease YdgD